MGKLTHKEKIEIVRECIIERPQTWKYGYNRSLIRFFEEEYKIKISDKEMSCLIKEVKGNFIEEKESKIKKYQLEEMLLQLHDQCDKIESKKDRIAEKRRTLQEIGKLDGHYEETLIITQDPTNGELKRIAQDLINRRAEEKAKELNGKSKPQRKTLPKK